VYDYHAGKVDWLAHGLPIEGEHTETATVGSLARDDVVTCALADMVSTVHERIANSRYPFAIVVGDRRVVFGRLPGSKCDCDPGTPVEDVMESGPSTVRPHKAAATIAKTLAEKQLRWAIVTTPEGELVGVATRTELEAAE
jgi:CBS domain-containing protein